MLGCLRASLAGRYEVQGLLGQGGTSLVFRATDLRHRREVAIKVLEPSISMAIGTDRFMREIEIAARLAHPHILPLLDSGAMTMGSCRCPYYVMPLVEGESLRERLARGPLPPDEATRIAADIAGALDYAHRHGVVHRDIKPENVLFQDGLPVIADFGIARALDEAGGGGATRSGVLLGTPPYMSPEQVTGDPIDHRTDVYSLGCVLYEMLTGTPPFADESIRSVLARRVAEPPPRVRSTGVQVSPSVEVVIQRAMATDPGERFGSAADFVSALRASQAGRSLRPPRWQRAAVVALPVVVVAAIALATWARRGDRGPISTLAIRPLLNMSQDSTTLYLSEGLEEAVADRLRSVPQLSVTAPALVNQILAGEPGLDLQALGRRVHAGAVLTWTLRRQGDSVRLRAELVRSDDGGILWGQTYERSVGDVVAVPGEIARTVSESLRLGLGVPQMGALGRPPTRDGAAYDAYLRGRRVWLRATPLGASGARSNADSILYYANRALERDPDFAGGHFLRAAYYNVSAIRGWREPFGAVLDSGLAANRRALALDSTMADPWVLEGVVHFYVTDRLDEAAKAFRRGVAVNPDLPSGRQFYGLYLGEVERWIDSAIAQLRRAVDLDPQSSYLNSLGDMYLRARRFDSAAGVLRQAIQAEPSVPGPHTRLVRALEELGRYAEAVEARRRGPDSASAEAFAAALQRNGPAGYRRMLEGELRTRIEELVAQEPGARVDTIPPIREHRVALLYARLGDAERAMDWVLREYQRRPGRLAFVLGDPNLDLVRKDPRFQPLVRSAGLEHLLERR